MFAKIWVTSNPGLNSHLRHLSAAQGNSQLLSCGQWGDVTVWSVNEMSEADVAGTSEVDFGLRVGGRVRLLKNSALLRIGLDAARPAHRLPGVRLQRTRDVALLPRDNNQVRRRGPVSSVDTVVVGVTLQGVVFVHTAKRGCAYSYHDTPHIRPCTGELTHSLHGIKTLKPWYSPSRLIANSGKLYALTPSATLRVTAFEISLSCM